MKINAPLLIDLTKKTDPRGTFMEVFRLEQLRALGIEESFVQSNCSYSEKGVIRGLHFQNPRAQGKLIFVASGEIFDVAVDVRKSSPTFSKPESVLLSSSKPQLFYVPPGFAHGFQCLSSGAIVFYHLTDYYDPSAERTLLWNDPELQIKWPLENPKLSDKDLSATELRHFKSEHLFL